MRRSVGLFGRSRLLFIRERERERKREEWERENVGTWLARRINGWGAADPTESERSGGASLRTSERANRPNQPRRSYYTLMIGRERERERGGEGGRERGRNISTTRSKFWPSVSQSVISEQSTNFTGQRCNVIGHTRSRRVLFSGCCLTERRMAASS